MEVIEKIKSMIRGKSGEPYSFAVFSVRPSFRTKRLIVLVMTPEVIRRIAIVATFLLLIMLMMLLTVAGCFAERLMFYPKNPQELEKLQTEMLEVVPGVSINVLYIPNLRSRYTILYNHGNTAQLADLEYTMANYARQGFSVIAYDYEGYGDSDGVPDEPALYRDADRVYRFLTEEKQIPPERIIIYGRSIGSGPACYLASKHKAAALVLESPFTSAFAVVGLSWLPFDSFRNIDRIDKINMPLLVMHGENDKLIDIKHGRALFEKAREPKEFLCIKGAGHDNISKIMGESYYTKIAEFAAGLPLSVSKPPEPAKQ